MSQWNPQTTFAEIESAVDVLYTSNNPQHQKQAEKWLSQIQNSEQAFHIAAQLLESKPSQRYFNWLSQLISRFYAAQILIHKLKDPQLRIETALEMKRMLIKAVKNNTGFVQRKFCLAVPFSFLFLYRSLPILYILLNPTWKIQSSLCSH